MPREILGFYRGELVILLYNSIHFFLGQILVGSD